jgi:hypothetical protein
VGCLGQEIGGGGGHDQGVGPLGEGDVLDRLRALGIEQIGEHGPAGQRAEREGAHEALGVGGGDHGHLGARARQLAQQEDRLVGGDAAGDAQDQRFVVEGHGLRFAPGVRFTVRLIYGSSL